MTPWHELSQAKKAERIRSIIAAEGDVSAAAIAKLAGASRSAVIGFCYRNDIDLPLPRVKTGNLPVPRQVLLYRDDVKRLSALMAQTGSSGSELMRRALQAYEAVQ